MIAWNEKLIKEKKIEQNWNFAGIWGGGGILNVNTAEELNAIMTEFPLGPFSEIEVYILSDLKSAMVAMKKVAQMMAPGPK